MNATTSSRPLRRDATALAQHFHLVESSGARLIPVRMPNRVTGIVAFVLNRHGTGNTRNGHGTREVQDEREAFDLVKFGHYGIRTVCERTGREALRTVGDKVLRAEWTASATTPNAAARGGAQSVG